MKRILLVIPTILFLSCSVSKNKTSTTIKEYPSPSLNWTQGNCPCSEISLYLMEEKDPPKWFKLEGEAILELSSKVVNLEMIPSTTLDKIKQRVKDANGCVVFVDMRDYYGSDMFPVRKKNEVYFYWGKCK